MFFKKQKVFNQQQEEYLAFIEENLGSEEKTQDILLNYERLLEALKQLSEKDSNEESVILISVGCCSILLEQQIPTYLKQIAQDKKVTIFLIDWQYTKKYLVDYMKKKHSLERKDGEEEIYSPKDNPNISCEIFACLLNFYKEQPSSDQNILCQKLSNAITHVLEQKGRVFIANHTQAYSFEDITVLADIANKIKLNYPKTLQLYTQSGESTVRYYLDNQIDYETDIFGMKDNGTFKTLPKLEDLQEVDEFKPEFKLSPNLSSTF